MVRGVDNISRLISTRNSFYFPMSAFTSSALVGSEHLAVGNVSIFSDVNRLIDDGPLPNLWDDDPSPRDIVLHSLTDLSFGVDVHACAEEEKAEEDLPEGSTCVTGDITSISLSSDDDATECSEDAASTGSYLMSSSISPFTPPTSSRSSSPPTSPVTSSVTFSEDDERPNVCARGSWLPNLLSSRCSLLAATSSVDILGRLVEFQTPAFDDVDWFTGMVSAIWSEGSCWQLP